MTMPLLAVFDDVLIDPAEYRRAALALDYRTIKTGDETWHGIAVPMDLTLPAMVSAFLDGATTTLTFFRRSPHGQIEPNFIHSDEGMGQWTAILYLNPDPPVGDGTTFWKHRPTDTVRGSARDLAKDAADWEPWQPVEAKFNRLLLFDSLYFHSRALIDNYGNGDSARLVQVAFGTYPC